MTKRELKQIKDFKLRIAAFVKEKGITTTRAILKEFQYHAFTPEPGVGRVLNTYWVITRCINSLKRSKVFEIDIFGSVTVREDHYGKLRRD